MKMSSKDLLNLQIIDEIIPEPTGGAHRDKDLILDNVKSSIERNLNFFSDMDRDEILNQRKNKFLSIGRTKGFSSKASINNTLSMKENIIHKWKNILKKDYKIFYFGVVFIAIIILALFFL